MDRDRRSSTQDVILSLLASKGSVSAGETAAAADVTRQAAHGHLADMLRRGLVRRVGAGRSTRYVRSAAFERTWPLPELTEEHEVWKAVVSALPRLEGLERGPKGIFNYALTEMVNNAIDHSRGSDVQVVIWWSTGRLAFEVIDDGVGALANLRAKLGLPDDFAAIQQLSKGKTTTAPDRHTGEGIFFTSKAVDRFELESDGLRWIVDSAKDDQAVADSPRRVGTRVRCELDPLTDRTMRDVFAPYTTSETLAFNRSKVTIRLFESAGTFVSRSEAKRLAAGLEDFAEVELDFSGVEEVGQGFVDELLRVWADEHPGTRLIPTHMGTAVEMMVRRGLSTG